MSPNQFSFIVFCGALAIFIYGIRQARGAVQLLAGDRLRLIIAQLTQNRITALGIGALATLILQSSNATSITLVGFAASGSITLQQAMGVMLGADIGTTLVVMLLAVKQIATYSLLLLIIGILIELAGRSKRSHYLSMFFMGFGFIFFGMKLMVEVTTPLQNDEMLLTVFSFMADRPLLILVVATVFTIFVQNSAAPIGMAIALAFSGLINLSVAVPIVLGANIGTCSGSIIASLGSNTAGKRVAVAHFAVKLLGAVLAFVFIGPFILIIEWVGGQLPGPIGISGEIAIAHLLFNFLLVLIFTPFIGPAAWLIQKFLPEPIGVKEKFRPHFLDSKSLDTPSLAFANVRREILRMLDINMEMFRRSLTVLENNDRILLETIQSQDDQVDILDKAIKLYLAKLTEENLTADQADLQLHLLAMASKLEEIGDVINRQILEVADKKIRKARRFSAEGWNEITQFHSKVLENFQLAAASLATEDLSLAKRLVRHHEQLGQLEHELRQGHLQRLQEGRKETIETSSLHLDLASSLYRVNDLLTQLTRQAYPQM